MAFVLDASALLALTFREPGVDVVGAALKAGAQMSAANVAEVASRLHQEGWTDFGVNALFQDLPILVLPFDFDAAALCGRYRPLTDHLGLSLGDRAWTQLDLEGVDISCIR